MIKLNPTEEKIDLEVTSICGNKIDVVSIPKETYNKSATKISVGAFFDDHSLTELVIPDTITEIQAFAFKGCKNLKEITIPHTVKDIDVGTFSECKSLQTVNLSKGIEALFNAAFQQCGSLREIEIPAGTSSIGYAVFNDCENLEKITLPDTIRHIGESAFLNTSLYNNPNNWEDDVLYINNCLIKAKPSINGFYKVREGTVCIADGAFGECENLKGVSIPSSVKTIGKVCFSFCTSLKKAILHDELEYIGDGAFFECKELRRIRLPKSLLTIPKGLFCKCEALTNIAIPENVKWIKEYAFAFSGIKSITFPKGLETIGEHAFEDCANLMEFKIPNIKFIGAKILNNCKLNRLEINTPSIDLNFLGASTKHLVLGDNIECIGQGMFSEENELESVTFTSIKLIQDNAFSFCGNLKELNNLPKDTKIERRAFSGCFFLMYYNKEHNLTSSHKESFLMFA